MGEDGRGGRLLHISPQRGAFPQHIHQQPAKHHILCGADHRQLGAAVAAPFLLYRNERSRIRGFWFYNSEECDRISSLVNGLLKNRERGDTNGQVPRSAPTLPNPKPDNASIFNMLSKAQKEYNAQVSGQPKTPSENVTAGNVLKFFESAKQATVETQFHRVQPLSVDQLEKQQRAATPGEDLNLIPSGGGRDRHLREPDIALPEGPSGSAGKRSAAVTAQ